jgi:hypothetical protein
MVCKFWFRGELKQGTSHLDFEEQSRNPILCESIPQGAGSVPLGKG